MSAYVPKQGDIVWADFEPSKGHEIKKRRPALVISRDEYSAVSPFCIVCPITSTVRDHPVYYTLEGYQTIGQVSTQQLYTMDYTNHAKRKITYKETLTEEDFLVVSQLVLNIFNFPV